MSYPILYESTETKFTKNGLGFLSDCISCKVTEERNGSYEMEMEYPVSGIHYSDITKRRILLSKGNYFDVEQPFRIYKIDKPIGGVVTVYAQHISYDLSGYVVAPFTASDISAAMSGLVSHSMTTCPFTLSTTRTTAATFKADTPTSIRSWLGGKTGSLLDVYGGEYHFDRFTVTLENARGIDRGVVIRYGKNLTDLKQEENCSNVYTGVISFWIDSNGNEVHGNIVSASGTYDFTRILSVDCSQDFQTTPTVAQLDAKSTSYISENNIGVPSVNLTVSFVQHDSSDETIYWTDNEGNRLTDNEGNLLVTTLKGVNTSVNLGDTVNIYFEAYGIDAKAECIKTVWNVLLDCYDSVELGDAKSNMADTIVSIQKKIDAAPTANFISEAIAHQTELIKGGIGGHFLIGTNAAGQPNETFWMDADNKADAKYVLRANYLGIGFSTTGIDGTYSTAWTIDGHFNADYITTGTLKAIDIRGVNIYGSTITFGDDTNNMKMSADSSTSKLLLNSSGTYGMTINASGSFDVYAKPITGDTTDRYATLHAYDTSSNEVANVSASSIYKSTEYLTQRYGQALMQTSIYNGNSAHVKVLSMDEYIEASAREEEIEAVEIKATMSNTYGRLFVSADLIYASVNNSVDQLYISSIGSKFMSPNGQHNLMVTNNGIYADSVKLA